MRWLVSVCTAVVLGLLSPLAGATSITYDLTNVAGNTWQYDFSVGNGSPGAAIDEFSVFFPLGSYDNLQVIARPAGWDDVVLPPDPLLPSDGLFDFFALGSGIDAGSTLAGFSVRVDVIGPNAPGSTAFTIVDPNDFLVPLEVGSTAPNGVVAADEPPTLALLGVVLLAVIAATRRRLHPV